MSRRLNDTGCFGWAAILFFMVMISLVIAWKTAVWKECRADDHSRIYCWSLMSR